MSHHCFLLHISRMKADRNIISSVPGPLDMSWPWAMSISQTLGGLSEQISPLRAGHCLKMSKDLLLLGSWKYLVKLLAHSQSQLDKAHNYRVGFPAKTNHSICSLSFFNAPFYTRLFSKNVRCTILLLCWKKNVVWCRLLCKHNFVHFWVNAIHSVPSYKKHLYKKRLVDILWNKKRGLVNI